MRFLIEVKGYPSVTYRDPRRAGEKKRVNPSSQAKVWYARALLTAAKLRDKNPDARVAIGLPDFESYRSEFDQTVKSLSKLAIEIAIVRGDGTVECQFPQRHAR